MVRLLAKETKEAKGSAVINPSGLLFAKINPEVLARNKDKKLQKEIWPDLLLHPPGSNSPWLCDIKTLGNTEKYFTGPSTASDKCRVIRDRGTEVNKEYQRNADKIDRQFQPNLGDGEPGWVRSKLNEFKKVRGLAFGYYSEMSKDVAELIELLAKAKKGRVMTALNLHNPAEALSWARRGIMRSLGWGIALGWSRLKIAVFHEAVNGGNRGLAGPERESRPLQELHDFNTNLSHNTCRSAYASSL